MMDECSVRVGFLEVEEVFLTFKCIWPSLIGSVFTGT